MSRLPATRSRLLVALLAATLGVAVGLLIVVADQKRVTVEQYRELYELAMHPHAGMYVPEYTAHSPEGDAVRLGAVEPGRYQLLYFFTTTCPYCRESVDAWKRLEREARATGWVDVYGVALDSAHLARAYGKEHELTFPVVLMSDPRYARLFRVSGVPLTMLVAPRGQVWYARRGELSDGAAIDSVRTAFGEPPAEWPTDMPLEIPSVASPTGGPGS